MKTKVFSLIWLIAMSTFLLAQTPAEIASGQFDAELGICSHDGVVYLVYNTNTSADQIGSIVLKYRNNDGEDWITKTVAQNITGFTKPTISVNNGQIIVSYLDGWESYMAISSNQGDSWQATLLGRSFESSPYAERIDDEYLLYSLALPYPQHEQDNYLQSEGSDELKPYQRTVYTELDQDGEIYRFHGLDHIDGSLRTSGDLWIRQAGGGSNGGWPTFDGLVITSGEVKVYPGGGSDYPVETVFPGGLIEHAPTNFGAVSHRFDGRIIGPDYDPKYIVYAEVNGTTATLYLGEKIRMPESSLAVYPEYPSPNLADPLFTNHVAIADTIWVPMGGAAHIPDGSIFYCPNELWIKGTFAGNQTWASGSNIKIIGDILLAGTPAGEDPSGNPNDFVSLISERSIEVKYGYQNPVDSLRYHVCRADDNPICIYASLAAMGRNDGCFTFEYQHPHPSVPAVNIYDSYWDNIDLHRYRFPQITTNPWPATIDYPFYNPLWPERAPYLERGTVQLWGSLHERYRGYLHRGYINMDNPNPEGIWDIENGLFGSSSSPVITTHTDPVLDLDIELTTRNFPGAIGNGVGYQRVHHRDVRRTFSNDLRQSLGASISYYDGTDPEDPDSNVWKGFLPVTKAVRSKVIARNGDAALYAVNSNIAFENGAQIESIYPFGDEDTAIIEQMDWVDDQRVMIVRHDASNPEPYSLHILNPYTLDVVDVPAGLFGNQQTEYPELLCDILPSVDGHGRFALYPLVPWVGCQNSLEIYNIDLDNGEYALHRSGTLPWDYSCDLTNQHQLEVKNVTDNQCDVILNIQQNGNDTYTSIRYATIQMSNTSNMDDHMVPAAKPSVSVYPNPSRADFSITVKNLAPGEVKAEVFNIRGQKVAEIKDFSPASDAGLNSRWQALDANQQRLAAGVYLMRIKQQGKVIATKRITVF